MQKEKLAIILSRFPYPLNKGDKLRAYYQIKYLSNQFDIYLFALTTEPVSQNSIDELTPYCTKIDISNISKTTTLKGIIKSLLQGYPIQVGYFFSSKIKKEIQEKINKQNIKKVYCQLSRTALYAEGLNVFKVIDFQDAFSINYLRLSQKTTFIHKLFYLREYKTMKAFEQKMFSDFDYSTIITEYDQEQLANQNKKMVVIPNGVETNYFSPIHPTRSYDIAFVGNLSYLPNKQAVLYLLEKIYPIIKKEIPTIKINIAGADTPKELYRFTNENITISGFVKDIREVYSSAKIFIAPLFTGAGLQNKLLEAMSMELPCISSEIVCQSLNASHLENIFIASTPNEFTEYTFQLLQSDELRANIGKKAREFVLSNFSWDTANKKLADLLCLNK